MLLVQNQTTYLVTNTGDISCRIEDCSYCGDDSHTHLDCPVRLLYHTEAESLSQGERLQGILKQREYASRQAERAYHARYWSPQLFITLTFRNAHKEEVALRKVRDYITQTARHKNRYKKEGLGRHIFGFGWADYQPKRKLNTNEDSMHVHMFVEVNGGLPPWVDLMLDTEDGSRKCPLFGPNWIHGDVYVERYTPERYAVTYAAVGHEHYIEFTGCPSRNRQCKKKQDGRTCVYVKDRQIFLDRHR